MTTTRTRLSIVEYGSPVDLSGQIAKNSGMDRTKANGLLTEGGRRAASTLGLSYNPISVGPKGAKAIDFAGLIRLTPSIELEVTPKFLGFKDGEGSWREDFFFLSTLSRYGRLLTAERLSSSGGNSHDLSTLAARAIAEMYEERKRRPLRSYRRVRDIGFFIEGDVDPLDLIFPSPEGFEQELIQFDRRNGWNSDIMAAAKALLPEISDPSVVSRLVRLIEDLAPQSSPATRRKPIPSRNRSWKPLHDLSLDVLRGLGVNYRRGHAYAPGYVVVTWRIWEDLLTTAARLGFGQSTVVPQKGFKLGSRVKVKAGSERELSVFPDCVIEADGDRPRLLLDAKYKGRAERGEFSISPADVYEALAFSRAAACNLVVLAYPRVFDGEAMPVGTCLVFEKVQVGNVKIIGVQVESRFISKSGALKEFSQKFSKDVAELIGQDS